MRLMLAGDTHGSLQQMGYLFQEAIEFDVDRIFVLGDFGYWEHRPAGVNFLDKTEEVAALAEIPVYWLDGNHENHTLLRSAYSKKQDDEGFWIIRPNIRYSPRGHRFTWDGCEFLTLGGAYSIDGPDNDIFDYKRTHGKDWWPEEQITDDEVDACGTAKVDIMLTHDIPAGVDMQQIMAIRGVRYNRIEASEDNRWQIRDAVEAVQPDWLFHGHYHVYHRTKLELRDGHEVNIQGLGCDGYGRQSYTIIEVGEVEEEALAA